jgi:hypothetical protein
MQRSDVLKDEFGENYRVRKVPEEAGKSTHVDLADIAF